MSYIAVTLNHFRALQDWAIKYQADVRLDMTTFQVNVQWRDVRFNLHPQFLNTTDDGLNYSSVLSPAATGFIGWLPYRPIQWPYSSNKLDFKRFLGEQGMKAPAIWPADARIDQDYVLKLPAGSFGQTVFGPYRQGFDARTLPEHLNRAGDGIFAEQFIAGRNVKVWYWGGVPFHFHVHPYPSVQGDGMRSIEELISRRLGRLDGLVPENQDKPWIVSSLAYQGLGLPDILPEGREAWIEYRYGRRYAPDPMQPQSDDMMAKLSASALEQVAAVGALLHDELVKTLRVPVLFALDAVLDSEDQIWWLEANSNPILPPSGYPLILSTLFEIDEAQSDAPPRHLAAGTV
ncbi:hypothetical protein [Acidovorax cavernicola]|uniref:hypothetical protein n=1 Tax=Acidovorax cavernicola TaxID=1675792 RepID=UPI0011C38BB3|nr:hypothetical protein [Acidovorax cavernicola]